MAASILTPLETICREYQKFQARLVRPDLKQLVSSIINYEQRHIEDLREAGSEILSSMDAVGELPEKSFSSSQPGSREGLQAMRDLCLSLADCFEGIASGVSSTDAAILAKQIAGDERKMAGLLDDRLELESLLQ